jgi:RimJ/RimL family protein N-acetyltransferase
MMFARTERLTLRPGWVEDAPALAQAIAHESVVTKLAQVPWPYAVTDAEWFLTADWPKTEVRCLILAHEDAGEPRLVGCIGLHDTPEGETEIGYWLTPSAWGRGYATEAGRAMLGIARYGLGRRRLLSNHFLDNPASGRVLRKLGFVATGRIESRASRARGHAVPVATYTLDLDGDVDRPTMRMAA